MYSQIGLQVKEKRLGIGIVPSGMVKSLNALHRSMLEIGAGSHEFRSMGYRVAPV